MTTGIKIDLTLPEFLNAAITAAMRQHESVSSGRKDNHGLSKDKGGINLHFEGASGEIAAAKALGVYFSSHVGSFKDADLGEITQVRTRSEHHWELIVRKNDNPDHVFVLVTGTSPSFYVRGWMKGQEAKDRKYLANHGGREPAYFIPTEDLHPIEEFFESLS